MENQFSISHISQFKVLSKHLQYINKTHKYSTSSSGLWPVEVAYLYIIFRHDMDSSETSAVTLESKGHRDETMQTGCITQRFWMLSHFRSVATLDFERSFSLQSVSVGHCCELFSVTHCGFPRTPVNISAVVCQSEKNLNEFWPNEFEFNEWMNELKWIFEFKFKKGVKIITFEVSS